MLLHGQPAAAGLNATLIQKLETALNNGDSSALAVLVNGSDGLVRTPMESRYELLRERFPDSRWQLSAGKDLPDGRSTLEVQVSGSGSR